MSTPIEIAREALEDIESNGWTFQIFARTKASEALAALAKVEAEISELRQSLAAAQTAQQPQGERITPAQLEERIKRGEKWRLLPQVELVPDCGEAGHDDGCCGNRDCLPSARNKAPQQAEAVPSVQIVNCDTCKHSTKACDDYPCRNCGVEFGDGPFDRWEAQQAEAVPITPETGNQIAQGVSAITSESAQVVPKTVKARTGGNPEDMLDFRTLFKEGA